MLLINPAATVQIPIEYMVLEIVDGLADIERCLAFAFGT